MKNVQNIFGSTTSSGSGTAIPGPPGDKGEQGIQGLKGDFGSQGVKGDIGPQGLQGLQGVKGDVGAQGIQGIKGQTGNTGAQGIQGVKGDVGVKGDIGTSGLTLPGSSTNQAIVLWNGTAGNNIINSPAIVTTATAVLNLSNVNGNLQIAGINAFPTSSTINTIPKFNSATGRSLSASSVAIDASNNISCPGIYLNSSLTLLSEYSYDSANYGFNGPWGSTGLANVKLNRIGKTITLFIAGFSGVCTVSTTAGSTTAIPNFYWPTTDVFNLVQGTDSGKQAPIVFKVATTGYLYFGVLLNSSSINAVGSFSAGIGNAGWSNFGCSWVI